MHSTLQLVLILLAAAVFMVVIFRILHLPPLLGYLLVGISIGPHAWGLIPNTPETRYLGEFGIVFLMFSIGLEFSLSKLHAMRSIVFGLGGAQVATTLLIVIAGGAVMGLDWRAGLALGGIIAMSSTAIVSKMMVERGELNASHGNQVLGILLFQDLALIPLLILIPALAAGGTNWEMEISKAILKAILILVILLYVGQKLMRGWFYLVAKQRSSELFVLNVLFITLGLAWLTEMAGLSMALGAFLAGALISETQYRHQVEEDIKPFRDILLGLFFISIGMLLDFKVVIYNFGWVALGLVILVLFKLFLITGLSRLFGNRSAPAFRAGFYLAQAGEFSFVLLAQATGLNLFEARFMNILLASMLLSMFLAPFIIQYSDPIIRWLCKSDWLNQSAQLHQIAVRTLGASDHVILCGYGRSGQSLARFLEQENFMFVALDLDPQRVNEAAAAGEDVVYGDASRREALMAAGLMRAKAVAITYNDITSALKILHHVREARPDIPVIVRTKDDSNLEKLIAAGATEVVPEILEGAIMLASQSLILLGTPLNRVLRHIRETREQRYHLLRGIYRGASDDDDATANALHPQLHTVFIPKHAVAVGKTLKDLNLAERSVEVKAVRRRNIRGMVPMPETQLQAGDAIVLMGMPEDLVIAEEKLLKG